MSRSDKNDPWSTTFNMKDLDKCRVVDKVEDLPYECWIIPGRAGIPPCNPLYFRRMPDGKEYLFEPYGEGRFYEAGPVMTEHGPFRMMSLSACTIKGDDRQIYKDDEELEEALKS